MKKIVIAGGSGYLGSLLAKYFSARNCEVIILSRNESSHGTENIKTVLWDARNHGRWGATLEEAEAIINLTGKSVNCRYNEGNKKLIYSSRLESTKIIGEAIERCNHAPKLWINAASATIYRSSYDKPMTEALGEIGHDFSMDVCKKWEAQFNAMLAPSTRKVILRTSIVIGNSGGAFLPYKILTKTGFGGVQGNGNQRISWIHEEDFCRVVDWIVQNENAAGVYNTTSPEPTTNKKFMRELRKALHVPLGLNLPSWFLEMGSAIVGTETELLLKSRWVIPERLLAEGFRFTFSKIEEALKELA
jgi:uncharacterized protein (TIGR01777 family)